MKSNSFFKSKKEWLALSARQRCPAASPGQKTRTEDEVYKVSVGCGFFVFLFFFLKTYPRYKSSWRCSQIDIIQKLQENHVSLQTFLLKNWLTVLQINKSRYPCSLLYEKVFPTLAVGVSFFAVQSKMIWFIPYLFLY